MRSLGTVNLPLKLFGQLFYVTERKSKRFMLSLLSGVHILEFAPPAFLIQLSFLKFTLAGLNGCVQVKECLHSSCIGFEGLGQN